MSHIQDVKCFHAGPSYGHSVGGGSGGDAIADQGTGFMGFHLPPTMRKLVSADLVIFNSAGILDPAVVMWLDTEYGMPSLNEDFDQRAESDHASTFARGAGGTTYLISAMSVLTSAVAGDMVHLKLTNKSGDSAFNYGITVCWL